MSHTRTTPTISTRIRDLIDKHHDGNVSEAASMLGISQRGLQKIYHGETTDPHVSIIVAIARIYGRSPYFVDVHQLILGTPAPEVAQVAHAQATDIVRQMLAQVGTGGARTPRRA